MPSRRQRFTITTLGGMNANDQADQLILRNFSQTPDGIFQRFPAESPDLNNIDFDDQGLRKRKGSTEADDLTGILVSGDTLLRGVEWVDPTDGTRDQIIVSVKTIYIKQSGGSWAQINDAEGNAYAHNSNISKVSFAIADGHLFIGMDEPASVTGNSAVPIQVFKSGADLDDQMHNSTTTTTVDQDSSSGQTLLYVADTTPFIAGDRIVIDIENDGGGTEYAYVSGVSAGDYLVLTGNLSNSHTAAQADTVKVANRYEQTYSNTTNNYTGNIGTGMYLLCSLHSRIVFSNGNTLLEYTPMAHTTASGIYDYAGGTSGFYQTVGNIRALIPFAAELSNTLDENLYIGTSQGFEITTGFTNSDNLFRIEGTKAIFNHQSWCKSKNWLIYLTDDANIIGLNGTRTINLGRRMKTPILDGPLDGLDATTSINTAFGFYNSKKEQANFYFSTATTNVNDRCIILDFKLGEPVMNEPQDAFETRVRCIQWNIKTPDTNDWYRGMYQILGSVLGITGAGKTWTMDGAEIDMDSIVIESYWYSPYFTAGMEAIGKQWLELVLIGTHQSGTWPVYVQVFLNRDSSAVKTWSYSQGSVSSVYGTGTYGGATYSLTASPKGVNNTDQYSETIQWKLYNNGQSQPFVVTHQSLDYMYGVIGR